MPEDWFPHVLREYALLADGERGALIGPRGDIGWLCAPRWDSDAVFSALIGGRGVYAVSPTGPFVWGGHYEDGNLIWRSRWVTGSGIAECREALAFPAEQHRLVLLRRVRAVRGPTTFSVRLRPVAGFGRHALTSLACEAGYWHGRLGPLRMRWSGPPARVEDSDGAALCAEFTLAEGAEADLVLELADRPLPERPPDTDRCWRATETAWRDALPDLGASLAPRDVRHAYAVLRGLTSAGGGMVAAATTSLPERAEQGRNYDYRYVWIRDQCYAGQAVALDRPHPLLDDAVRFVAERLLTDGSELKPAYTVDGGRLPDQRAVGLPGYPGGTDVVGNHVNTQFQLDALGETLLLFAAAARRDRLDSDALRALRVAVAAVERRWREPDAGIWELDDRRWAHSRLTCAAGLRAVAGVAVTAREAAERAALADRIVADAADCLHPSGRWQRAPQDPRVDAALLLSGIRGAVPPNDPGTRATLRAVLAELTEDGYAYRFRQDARPLGEAEGAFTLCGFMVAMALHQDGDAVGAARWFERNRAACGPPGLFSEEYDVAQRQLRGNLPQAFVHALLLESAVRLSTPPATYGSTGHRLARQVGA